LPLLFLSDSTMVDFIVEHGVNFVTTSAGDPGKYINVLKSADITVYHAVPSLAGAKKAFEAGVDGLVVEGTEGGGFKSPEEVGLFVLIQAIKNEIDLPIVAAGVEFDGSWDWVLRGIENYSRYIFDGYMMPWEKYFDCGFIIVNEKHKQFFQDIVSFYFTYQDNLIKLQQTFFNGTDQTPVNMLVHRNDIDLKLLPYEFNMNDMNRKEILADDMLFTKCGWVYQYNAIPNNEENRLTNYFMEKTYQHFYGDLVEDK